MNRHFLVLFFWVAVCIFGFLGRSDLHAEDRDSKTRIATQAQAAEFASKLANERCKKSFNTTPFSPDSYTAELSDSRWHWGKIEPPGIHGFSAEIGFNMDGLEQEVRVVYHVPAVLGESIKRGDRHKK